MSRSKLGLHWLRYHSSDWEDFGHISLMQYRSIKLFNNEWGNREFCGRLVQILPSDCLILVRDHPLSEQKEEMYTSPYNTGIRHADEWNSRVKDGTINLPLDRSYFLGINEPDSNNHREAIDTYTVAFLDRLAGYGLKGGAFNFGTGHPRTVDGTPYTDPDWGFYEKSRRSVSSGDHIAVAHIYGTSAVPLAPGHYSRLSYCHWPEALFVIGECGVDGHVIGGGPHSGYLDSVKERYPDWLNTFMVGVESTLGPNNPKIHSYQVFTYDFSHPWSSFDIRPVRNFLENYDWTEISSPPSPPSPPPPSSSRFMWPVEGIITQLWGQDHNGLDIAAKLGMPVVSVADGTVAWVDIDENYGKYVRVWHPQLKIHSFYAHMDTQDVSKGQSVKAGQKIGTIGTTGNSTGPHLHFEIRVADKDGRYVETKYYRPNGRIDPLSALYVLERTVV